MQPLKNSSNYPVFNRHEGNFAAALIEIERLKQENKQLRDRVTYLEDTIGTRDLYSVTLDDDEKTWRCVFCGAVLDSGTLELAPGEMHGCLCPKGKWPIQEK